MYLSELSAPNDMSIDTLKQTQEDIFRFQVDLEYFLLWF